MKSGVSFPSYASLPAFAMVSGSADASYPVQNLSDLKRIRRIFKAGATGAVSFTFILPAAASIQFLGLMDHNGAAGSTVRYRLFSDNNPDPVGNAGAIVHDSTAVGIFPTGSAPSTLWAQNRPYKITAAVTARSCRIDLSAHASKWEIGGLEIAGWWEWTDVAVPREFGVSPTDVVVDLGANIQETRSQWSPRTVIVQRSVVTQTENETTAQDFMLEKQLSKPFVWVWDYDDATTWPREVILVTNASMPRNPQNTYPAGSQSFAFLEHLGG